MASSKNNFYKIGNLAFYDEWHPDYFYFNHLLTIAESEDIETHNGWDPVAAAQAAQHAINDANAHMNLNGLEEDDAMEQMSERFRQIYNFLNAAYNYELKNEIRYFNQKYNQLKENFTNEELSQIEPLAELLEMFEKAETTNFDYDRFITLINILLNGIKNTKTIAEYEEKRIKSIDAAVEKIISKRGNQAAGLGKSRKKSQDEIIKMTQRAEDRMREKIEIEYMKTGNLSGGYIDEKGKYNYNIWGYKKYFSKLKPTIDVAVAHWATSVLQKTLEDPSVIKKFCDAIQSQYPTNGNFWSLQQDCQKIIIQSIQHYGLEDLSKILKSRMSKNIANNVATAIIKDQSIFNAVQGYDIKGLNPNYGMYGLTLDLFKGVNSIAAMKQQYANQLFDAFDRLMVDKQSKWGITKEQDFLLNIFKKNKSLTAIEEMRSFIKRLQELQNKIEKIQNKIDHNLIKIDEVNGKQISGGRGNKKITVSLQTRVENGQVIVEIAEEGSSLGQIISTSADFRRFGFKKFNPQNLKSAIRLLKTRASSTLKTNLINGLNQALSNGTLGMSQSELIAQIRQGFQNLRVSIGGPKLSEIAAGIHFRTNSNGDTIIDWQGGLNGKNDVVTITVNVNEVASSIRLDFEEGITSAIQSVSEKQIIDARKEFLQEWNEELKNSIQYNTTNDSVDKYSSVAKQFLLNLEEQEEWDKKLQEKYAQLEKMWKQYKLELERLGATDEQIEAKRKKFLNILGQSFYVSTTVKTYNEYQNRIGFLGGSLGSDLDDQLNRIADIFAQCGMPIKNDLQWLRFAIINCSPLSIMKDTNKNLIENYLGSVAALALFDEGGAEGQIINQFAQNLDQSVDIMEQNANILHLYKVNGIYVPGSFVLQQIMKSIETDVIPKIQQIPNVMRRGAGIVIINGANTGMIPNRPIAKTQNPDTKAWQTTGNRVKETVKLQILFLAGLFDIVNSINKTLGNFEIAR